MDEPCSRRRQMGASRFGNARVLQQVRSCAWCLTRRASTMHGAWRYRETHSGSIDSPLLTLTSCGMHETVLVLEIIRDAERRRHGQGRSGYWLEPGRVHRVRQRPSQDIAASLPTRGASDHADGFVVGPRPRRIASSLRRSIDQRTDLLSARVHLRRRRG